MDHNKKLFKTISYFFLAFLFLLSVRRSVLGQGGCNPGCGSTISCSEVICSSCPLSQCAGVATGGKELGIFKGLGPLSDFINSLTRDNPAAATSMFTKIISNAVGIMTIVAVIWFIFTLLTGAISWLSSGGDKQKLQNAQKQITTGLVGLIIVISAIFLIKVIGVLFGFDILAISNLINNLWSTPTP